MNVMPLSPVPTAWWQLRSWHMWRTLCSFPGMLAAGLCLLAFQACSSHFNDPDLWWHLRVGREIVETQTIPAHDAFSFTAAGHAWIAHEWLAELVLYQVYQTGGFTGLQLAFSMVAAAIVILTFVLCGWWSGNWMVSLIGGISSLFFLTAGLTIRPALLGHLLLVVELLLLYRAREPQSRIRWALPPLFIVWANVHGSFLFGLVLLTIVTFYRSLGSDRQTRIRALAFVLLCGMMPFINPVGHRMVTYPLDVLWAQPDNLGNIEEWAALDIHDPRAFAFAAILLLVMAASATRRTVLQPLEWMLLIVTAGMSIQHVRMLPIFGIISAPIVCRVLASYWQGADPQRSHPLWNAILIAAALALSGAVLPDAAALDRAVESQQPVKAVARIQQAGWSGPMLNEYVWGGYLIWALPQHKVFIDGRADIYAWSGVLREYRKWALLEEDPALLLDRHGIRLILLRAKAPMSQVMPYLPGWRKAYDDGLAVIFVRG